jgi:hypothetical protein
MSWLEKARNSGKFTEAEMDCLMFQYGSHVGSFTRFLFEAIAHADPYNRTRLHLGFPAYVSAYMAWTEGDLYQRATSFLEPKPDISVSEDEPKKDPEDECK